MTQIFSEGTIPTRTIAGGGARTHTILRSLDFESSASASSATPAALKTDQQSTEFEQKLKRLPASRALASFVAPKNFAQNNCVAAFCLPVVVRLRRMPPA